MTVVAVAITGGLCGCAARTQLADTLAVSAPYHPLLLRARVDRGAALPSWRTATVRAGVVG